MASEIPAHVLPVASLPEATFLRHFEGRSFAMEFRASAEGSVAPRVGMRSVADGPGPSMSYKGGLHPVDELQQRVPWVIGAVVVDLTVDVDGAR